MVDTIDNLISDEFHHDNAHHQPPSQANSRPTRTKRTTSYLQDYHCSLANHVSFDPTKCPKYPLSDYISYSNLSPTY